MPPDTTMVTRRIDAPRAAVYRALLDPAAVQQWMVPDGMTSVVHSFDPSEGGTFRISLTYDGSIDHAAGKTDARTDTFHGRFQTLLPDTQVVQVVEFETDDPAMRGEMTITYRLSDTGDGAGTELVGLHEHLPPGVAPADNEAGWRMSLHKLAALVEDDG
ncbi:MAG: SRPBCC family protein [Actinomycetota bacterium]|nr:SRPBCC family protein [Actinomycetota bacterium]